MVELAAIGDAEPTGQLLYSGERKPVTLVFRPLLRLLPSSAPVWIS